MKISKFVFFAAAIMLLFSSCEEDPAEPINEEELITTLVVTLTPQSGGADKILRFEDLDGDGGNAPIITADTLADSTVYDLFVSLLNEAESPSENITEEVKEEDDEHQLFFDISGVTATYAYGDADENSAPLGLQGVFTTSAAGSGTLKVTLRHEPNKTAVGVSGGDITNAGGETDIEVTFNVNVQ